MKYLLALLFTTQTLAAFDWQGHRGARGLYPENTIAGMKLATTYPIQTLEMDVVLSKDQQVVLSHEPWMSPEICNAKDKTKIKDLTYREIAKFDCGKKPHPRFPRQKKVKETKPLLTALVKEMEKHFKLTGKQLNYNIEIKSDEKWEQEGLQESYEKVTPVIMDQILKQLPPHRFTLQSFDWRVLKLIKSKYPQVKLVALRESAYDPKAVMDELGFAPEVFSPALELLKAEDVTYFHEKGSKVIVWTVNTLEDMKKALSLGVDGIITDYPDLISQVPVGLYVSEPSCLEGFSYFEGKCIKIPAHAHASDTNPGWVCKKGYHQKRNSCQKIRIPKQAHFLEDGKTWVCNEGWERYRHRCVRSKKPLK